MKKMMIRMFMCTSALVAGMVSAKDWYVDVNAPGGGDGSAGAPFTSITAAVAAGDLAGPPQWDPDNIYVAAGTYTSNKNGGNEDFGSEGIELRQFGYTLRGGYAGDGDWSEGNRVMRSTVIDLTLAEARAFYLFKNYESRNLNPVIEGFSFINADHDLNGGAIGIGWINGHDWENCGMIVRDCLFSNNVTRGNGGGIFFYAT